MKQLVSLENPRKNVIEAMKASVPQDVWDKNLSFIDSLKQENADDVAEIIHEHVIGGRVVQRLKI